jgi:hypothetical protein
MNARGARESALAFPAHSPRKRWRSGTFAHAALSFLPAVSLCSDSGY